MSSWRGRELGGVLLLCVGALAAQAAAPPARLTKEQEMKLAERDSLERFLPELMQRGQNDKALQTSERIAALEKEVLGETDARVISSLQRVAGWREALGQYARAIRLRKEVVRLEEKRLGKGHWQTADARLALEDSRRRAGMSPEDRAALLQAQADQGRVEQLYRQGRYREAGRVAVRVLAVRRKVQGQRHPHYASSVSWLAVLYRAKGEHGKALPLFLEARDLHRKALGEKHPAYAQSLNNLAGIYQAMGEHRLALPLYQQALRRLKEASGERHPDFARILKNLAALYQDLGEHQKALPLVRQALRLTKAALGDRHPDYVTSLNNLAALYKEMGEHRLALPLLRQAVRLYKEALGERHPDYATSLNNLASLYQEMGEHRQALPLVQQALRLRREVQGEKHPRYADSLTNLAFLYQDLGEHQQALPLCRQALRLYKQALGEKHPGYATGLSNLASLYQERGRPTAAAALAGQALAVKQSHLEDSLSVLSYRQRRLALAQGERTLSFFLSVGTDLLPTSSVYGWVARSKGALASRLAEERLARDDQNLQPLLEELRDVRGRLARLAGQIPSPSGLEAWRSRFDELEGRKERLQSQLAQKSATFPLLQTKPTARRIGEALPARTALVEFLAYDHFLRADPRTSRWLTERRLLAFVLRQDREAAQIPLGAAAPVDRALRSWRLAVTSGGGEPRLEDARRLRATLWLPVEEHLGGIDTVLIAPDGALAQLPFAALPGRKAGSVLLEDYAIGYLSGGRQLLDPPGKQHRAAGLLALGGPDFGMPVNREETPAWQALPGAEEEARRIAGIFRACFASGPTRLLRGVGADRSRLLQALAAEKHKPRWRYLHVATHGYFDPSRPGLHPAALGGWTVGVGALPALTGWASALAGTLLASDPGIADRAGGFDPTGRSVRLVEGNPMVRTGLVLAGANRSEHESTLTAEEIAGLDLRGTELTVLSACETALGHPSGWQGVQGLPRAFHDAGVKNVLTSLWSVSDAATSVLMEQFYTRLWRRKQRPLEALWQAQLFVWKNPWSVRRRARELRALLAKRGVGEEDLAARRSLRGRLAGGGAQLCRVVGPVGPLRRAGPVKCLPGASPVPVALVSRENGEGRPPCRGSGSRCSGAPPGFRHGRRRSS
jgi:CHAT domain-containing protein/tetratricopeptide (TPR) repeat protein